MEALEYIKSRRSIRKFKDESVEFEKIGNILDAGRLAPSAGNLQNWKFILVTEEEARNNIAKACAAQLWMAEAPVHIVVCADHKKCERLYGQQCSKFSVQNSAAVIQNMLLAAHCQGLGACWVGAFEENALKKALSIPQHIEPQAVVAVGYANEKARKIPKYSLEEVTFIEQYGNKIKDLAAYMGYYSEHIKRAAKKGKELLHRLMSNK